MNTAEAYEVINWGTDPLADAPLGQLSVLLVAAAVRSLTSYPVHTQERNITGIWTERRVMVELEPDVYLPLYTRREAINFVEGCVTKALKVLDPGIAMHSQECDCNDCNLPF